MATDSAANQDRRQSLAPSAGEAAVLSLLAVAEDNRWHVAAGSLLTCPYGDATTSWRRWRLLQPRTRSGDLTDEGPDFGPMFAVDPSPGIRAIRVIVLSGEWKNVTDAIREGRIDALGTSYAIAIDAWSSEVFLEQSGTSDAHGVVSAACRPVSGIVATITSPPMPTASPFLELASPPHLDRGPDLGALFRHRHLVHWPEALLGVSWTIDSHDSTRFAPPSRFVIGRLHQDAWIADALPDHDTGHVDITICWDACAIDPLGCSLLVRSARKGLTLLARQIRISDLPAGEQSRTDAWRRRWNERTLTVSVPRGPRRSDWGVALLAPDGRLLDERPVAPRVERLEISINIMGSPSPGPTSVVGDPEEPPTLDQIDEAVEQAIVVEERARQAAAQRRFSKAGELERYLSWRLGCRAGEVLILDPSLVRGSQEDVERSIAFLASLDRPVRALCGSVSEAAKAALANHAHLDVRRLPDGAASLHDRFWLLGETGLAVGASPGGFLSHDGSARRATTATELPHADALVWRTQFESWWARS